MTMERRWRAVFLLIPVLALLLLAVRGHLLQEFGVERTFPVEGFDPRDLLSGHYLTYRLDYGTPDLCPHLPSRAPVHYCVEEKVFREGASGAAGCGLFMTGMCEQGRFVAGVERFYIPEERSVDLDVAVRNRRGAVVVAIAPGSGVTRLKELLLDGRPWREAKPVQ